MIDLLWNNPISETKMSKYVAALKLLPQQHVIDIGCGCGELLIRLAERYQVQGIGIDNSTEHIAEALRRAKARGVAGDVRFEAAPALTHHLAPEYRALLGDSIPDTMTHAANVASGIAAGLVPLAAWASSVHEFQLSWTPPDASLVGPRHLRAESRRFAETARGKQVPRYIFHVQGHSDLVARLVELKRQHRMGDNSPEA